MKKPSDVTKIVLKKSKKHIIIKTLISIAYRGIAMLTPILFSKAVDLVTAGDYTNAIYISIGAIVLVITFRLFDILNTYSWHALYNNMYDNYTNIGINKVFDNSLYSLSRFNIGEFLNMMTTDISIMSDFYCNLIMRLIRIVEVMVIFVYFFMINFYIGLAGVGVGLVSLAVILLSSNKIEKWNKEKASNLDERNTIVNEFLLSIREIKAFNIFKPMKKRIDDSTKVYTKSFLKQRVGEDAFKFSVLALIEAFRWCLFIYGIILISKGQMEMGTLLIIYNYFTQLVEGFSEFAIVNTGIRQLKVSQNKLLLDKKYKFKDFNIKFKDVLYGDKEQPRLKDVTFDIKSKSINSIVGVVGSGKSGIVDLLLKMNSQHKGTISIGGIQISDIDFEYYYSLISCIDKNDRFLNISIKDNLNIVNDDFEQIVHTCKKLGIHDEISQLKNGYDTILNSPDDKLKPNTKILLNIARILLKNTRILIFDEILCSLNNENRQIVLGILNHIKENHTIIIIDKKQDVLESSDHIILLNEGQVIETGSHEELIYNKLYKTIIEN